MSKTSLDMIPLDRIQENEAALRSVDKQGESFLGLVASVKTDGILNSIAVSPIKDTDPQQYRLVDGLQRFSAAQDSGLSEIPCIIRDMDETEVYFAQILANAHTIETKAADYAAGLQRILAGNPTMTMGDLAGKLSKSEDWLRNMLKLNKLNDQVKALVNDNKINLTNAQSLAKLPSAEQMDWLEQAQTEPPAEFLPKIAERARDIRKAAREGKVPEEVKFTPVEHLRKLAVLKELRNDPAIIKTAMAADGAKDPIQYTLDYILCMDKASIKVQEAKEEERKTKREADKEKRAVERTAKRAETANADAEKARTDYEAKKVKEAEEAKAAK